MIKHKQQNIGGKIRQINGRRKDGEGEWRKDEIKKKFRIKATAVLFQIICR